MKKLRKIRIIHDIKNRIDFLFLAEFFRMCGVYVGEYIYDKTHQNKEINIEDSLGIEDYDVDLYVGNETKKNMPVGILPENTIYYSDIQTKIFQAPIQIFKQTVMEQQITLSAVIDCIEILEDETGVFNALGTIYVLNNLMMHLANQQYYRKMNIDIHDDAIKAFSNAYDDIGNVNSTNVRYQYAQIYCANKANLACSHRHYSMKYKIDDLVLRCQDIMKKEPDFFNVWALIGLVYEQAPECGRQAVNAFSQALKEESIGSYVSHIYYFMGKRYEPYTENREDMIKCFKMAYRSKPRYRNLYKLAIIDYQDKSYIEALDKFEKIKGYLNEKEKLNYLDPLEGEYYYKISSLACYICYKCLKKYTEAIRWGEYACIIYNRLDNNLYYDDFYAGNVKKYVNISRKKMNIEKVYSYLAVSYREIGNEQKANEYWKKIKKETDTK